MQALIVDDSKAMRAILRQMLARIGYEPVEAADGREALARLDEMPEVHVALVDWNMPVMDGYALVRAVRQDARYDDVKIVMVTTETEMENVAQALDAGADEYVMKPFTSEVIVEKLALLGLEVAQP